MNAKIYELLYTIINSIFFSLNSFPHRVWHGKPSKGRYRVYHVNKILLTMAENSNKYEQ